MVATTTTAGVAKSALSWLESLLFCTDTSSEKQQHNESCSPRRFSPFCFFAPLLLLVWLLLLGDLTTSAAAAAGDSLRRRRADDHDLDEAARKRGNLLVDEQHPLSSLKIHVDSNFEDFASYQDYRDHIREQRRILQQNKNDGDQDEDGYRKRNYDMDEEKEDYMQQRSHYYDDDEENDDMETSSSEGSVDDTMKKEDGEMTLHHNESMQQEEPYQDTAQEEEDDNYLIITVYAGMPRGQRSVGRQIATLVTMFLNDKDMRGDDINKMLVNTHADADEETIESMIEDRLLEEDESLPPSSSFYLEDLNYTAPDDGNHTATDWNDTSWATIAPTGNATSVAAVNMTANMTMMPMAPMIFTWEMFYDFFDSANVYLDTTKELRWWQYDIYYQCFWGWADLASNSTKMRAVANTSAIDFYWFHIMKSLSTNVNNGKLMNWMREQSSKGATLAPLPDGESAMLRPLPELDLVTDQGMMYDVNRTMPPNPDDEDHATSSGDDEDEPEVGDVRTPGGPTTGTAIPRGSILADPSLVAATPLDVGVWDWRRYLGLGLFVGTILSALFLTVVASYRQRQLAKHAVWGAECNLATEQGVEELLQTRWDIQGSQLQVYDKPKCFGYSESMLMGGYEQREALQEAVEHELKKHQAASATDVTLTQPPTSETASLDHHHATDTESVIREV